MDEEVNAVPPTTAVPPFQTIGEMRIDENGMDLDAAEAIKARRAAEKAKREAHAAKVQAALDQ